MSLTSQDPSMSDKPTEDLSTNGVTAPVVRDLTYTQVIFWAAAIGAAGGLVATAYYYLLESSMYLVWHQVPEILKAQFVNEFLAKNYVWIAATIDGLLVGLSLYFMGLPGEVAFVVDKVHDPRRIDMKQTPAMIVASLFSIVAGATFGIAPLIKRSVTGQIAGTVGAYGSVGSVLYATTYSLLPPTVEGNHTFFQVLGVTGLVVAFLCAFFLKDPKVSKADLEAAAMVAH